jgi:hypothetical protein
MKKLVQRLIVAVIVGMTGNLAALHWGVNEVCLYLGMEKQQADLIEQKLAAIEAMRGQVALVPSLKNELLAAMARFENDKRLSTWIAAMCPQLKAFPECNDECMASIKTFVEKGLPQIRRSASIPDMVNLALELQFHIDGCCDLVRRIDLWAIEMMTCVPMRIEPRLAVEIPQPSPSPHPEIYMGT